MFLIQFKGRLISFFSPLSCCFGAVKSSGSPLYRVVRPVFGVSVSCGRRCFGFLWRCLLASFLGSALLELAVSVVAGLPALFELFLLLLFCLCSLPTSRCSLLSAGFCCSLAFCCPLALALLPCGVFLVSVSLLARDFLLSFSLRCSSLGCFSSREFRLLRCLLFLCEVLSRSLRRLLLAEALRLDTTYSGPSPHPSGKGFFVISLPRNFST